MESIEKIKIRVQTIIDAPLDKVWDLWNNPADIIKWNYASDDWHTTRAENNLREGGNFNYRMEAKDRSMGFDFWGVYDLVVLHEQINITLGDGRKVKIVFTTDDNQTSIVETFEAESINTIELQRNGWQAILDNFKKYAEANQK